MCRTATITWGENNPICRSFLIIYSVSREFYSGFRGNELKILNPKTLLFITISWCWSNMTNAISFS